jgi:hypothetical protein
MWQLPPRRQLPQSCLHQRHAVCSNHASQKAVLPHRRQYCPNHAPFMPHRRQYYLTGCSTALILPQSCLTGGSLPQSSIMPHRKQLLSHREVVLPQSCPSHASQETDCPNHAAEDSHLCSRENNIITPLCKDHFQETYPIS